MSNLGLIQSISFDLVLIFVDILSISIDFISVVFRSKGDFYVGQISVGEIHKSLKIQLTIKRGHGREQSSDFRTYKYKSFGFCLHSERRRILGSHEVVPREVLRRVQSTTD